MKNKALKKIFKSFISYLCILMFIILAISVTTGCKQESVSKNLSNDQKVLVAVFGYPDQFLAVFDENNRSETWLYEAMQYCFTFKNGVYSGRQRYVPIENIDDKYNINPSQFSYDISSVDIGKIIGGKCIEVSDPGTGYKTIIFGEGSIACTFDTKDKLVCILRQKALYPED